MYAEHNGNNQSIHKLQNLVWRDHSKCMNAHTPTHHTHTQHRHMHTQAYWPYKTLNMDRHYSGTLFKDWKTIRKPSRSGLQRGWSMVRASPMYRYKGKGGGVGGVILQEEWSLVRVVCQIGAPLYCAQHQRRQMQGNFILYWHQMTCYRLRISSQRNTHLVKSGHTIRDSTYTTSFTQYKMAVHELVLKIPNVSFLVWSWSHAVSINCLNQSFTCSLNHLHAVSISHLHAVSINHSTQSFKKSTHCKQVQTMKLEREREKKKERKKEHYRNEPGH